MKRDLKAMSQQHFDLLVIGGGISGACIAWDAALRGLRVALVEKGDFANSTSSATSKLIHGGLRYLKNAEFGLVRESLRERRIMQTISPHMVYPYPILMPTFGWGMSGPLILGLGMVLYQLLAFDRNRLPKGFAKLPRFRFFSKKKMLAKKLGLNNPHLNGGLLYYDCQLFKPEKHTTEFIRSAERQGAMVANYTRVTGFLKENSSVKGAWVQDELNHQQFKIEANLTINASGPWADILLDKVLPGEHQNLVRSKGIHIITKPYITGQAVGISLPDGKHIFCLPWRGYNIFGTTDTTFDDDPDRFRVTRKDVLNFIEDINRAFNQLDLAEKDVLSFYGGMRPLVEQTEATSSYQASRKYEVLDHQQENDLGGFITVEGGKYTTSRHLAETIVDLAVKKLQVSVRPCSTAKTPLMTGEMTNFSELLKSTRQQFNQFDVPLVDYLCHMYGNDAARVLELASKHKKLSEAVAPGHFDLMAQVEFGLQNEMAMTLEDVLVRRLGLGNLGKPPASAVKKVASYMAKKLRWPESRRKKEIASFNKRYELK